jgi:hypothetical protein
VDSALGSIAQSRQDVDLDFTLSLHSAESLSQNKILSAFAKVDK